MNPNFVHVIVKNQKSALYPVKRCAILTVGYRSNCDSITIGSNWISLCQQQRVIALDQQQAYGNCTCVLPMERDLSVEREQIVFVGN